MTVARPVAAFFSAFIAGLMENLFFYREGVAEPLQPLKILPLWQASAKILVVGIREKEDRTVGCV